MKADEKPRFRTLDGKPLYHFMGTSTFSGAGPGRMRCPVSQHFTTNSNPNLHTQAGPTPRLAPAAWAGRISPARLGLLAPFRLLQTAPPRVPPALPQSTPWCTRCRWPRSPRRRPWTRSACWAAVSAGLR